MKLSKVLLAAGIVLGLLTAFFLYIYLDTLQAEQAEPVPYTDVVVAETSIPAHTRITEEMLEVRSIPAEAAHPDSGQDVSLFIGGIARSEIVRGEQILTTRVHTDDMRATLSYRIPENKRAVSIPVNEVTGVSGYITPGDKVDVLLTIQDEEINDGESTTYTLLQNITVMAIGQLPREVEDDEARPVSTVTLEVDPEQAEVLAYANLHGSFHLTLRSPADEEIVTLEAFGAANFDDFRRR